MHSSSILSFLSTYALAFAAPYNNGQWSQDSGAWSAAATTTAATLTAKTWAATTAAPKAASVDGYGSGGWEMSVTWPVGCESWANPCPAGAHVSGGGVAGAATATGKAASGSYENPFTVYTTQTDANGVITGMPSKATIPAGMSVVPSAVAVSSSKNSTTLATSTTQTSTQTGFIASSTSTVRPQFTGAANAHVISTAGALVAAAGAVLALL